MTEKKLTIAHLGPAGTFSHAAAHNLFPDSTYLPTITITDAAQAILTGKADKAILPMKNSLAGPVKETAYILQTYPLSLIQTYDLPVQQNLLSLETNLEHIDVVYSHPQALKQCEHWLQEHLPHARQVQTNSTTEKLIAPEPRSAYIASTIAAEQYHLPIMRESIEDSKDNVTTFAVLEKAS